MATWDTRLLICNIELIELLKRAIASEVSIGNLQDMAERGIRQGIVRVATGFAIVASNVAHSALDPPPS